MGAWMATRDKALDTELYLLRSLARRRRAESLKLVRQRMMAGRGTAAEAVPPRAPVVAEARSRRRRDAA